MIDRLKRGLYLPPFGPLSDPRLLARLSAEAETAGWDGVFLWDHVLRPRDEVIEIADPWICLAAMAIATRKVRLGAMVTPVTRRRPIKLAREIATLDHLSGGRVNVGFGLGDTAGGELRRFGEVEDDRTRAERLDEGVALIDRLLAGDAVRFQGRHFVADDVVFGPRPVQSPRPPFWFASVGPAPRPIRRASRFEGLFVVRVDAEGLKRTVDRVAGHRAGVSGFDIVVYDGNRGPRLTERELLDAGVTWFCRRVPVGATPEEVRSTIAEPDYRVSGP